MVNLTSRNEKTLVMADKGFDLVAWGRIELPTRGFSTHVAAKTSMFTGLAARKRDTCYKPCYTKTTEFCSTFLL
jgi:hypothetical protein